MIPLSIDRFVLAKQLKSLSGYKCEGCGKKVDSKESRSLVLHHIDRDEYNNEIENLIILCRQCHRDRHCERGWIYDEST